MKEIINVFNMSSSKKDVKKSNTKQKTSSGHIKKLNAKPTSISAGNTTKKRKCYQNQKETKSF